MLKETFGQYIKRLRTEKGLTLTQLGAVLGLDSGALSKIENDKKSLDPITLPIIADYFKLNSDDLKSEYFSEKIAKALIQYECKENTLKLAEEKIQYLKAKYTKQIKLKL